MQATAQLITEAYPDDRWVSSNHGYKRAHQRLRRRSDTRSRAANRVTGRVFKWPSCRVSILKLALAISRPLAISEKSGGRQRSYLPPMNTWRFYHTALRGDHSSKVDQINQSSTNIVQQQLLRSYSIGPLCIVDQGTVSHLIPTSSVGAVWQSKLMIASRTRPNDSKNCRQERRIRIPASFRSSGPWPGALQENTTRRRVPRWKRTQPREVSKRNSP